MKNLGKAKFLTVKVKKSHIVKGKPRDGSSCPIAKAFRDVKGRPKGKVHVDAMGIGVGEGIWDPAFYQLPVPKKARMFMYRFDKRKPVKPFTFRVKYYA